ncbi:hypothetical protein [Kamptonema animale]|nr:hypothetical protein [Kamptonema animale]
MTVKTLLIAETLAFIAVNISAFSLELKILLFVDERILITDRSVSI